MIQRTIFFTLILITLSLMINLQVVLGAPDSITYQGKLTNAVGQSVPDGNHPVQFRFYDALTGGSLLWWSPEISVSTNAGVFTTIISGIPGSVFAGGNDRWIETVVGGQILSPRVKLTSVAYSLGNWSLSGNQGTIGSTNFIGTLDDQPLTFKVFNRTALRLEPVSRADGYSTDYTVNVIGGDKANYVTPGVFGATIGGGGYHLCVNPNECYDRPNIVTDDYSTVSGGTSNQAGDNAGTTYDKYGATVGGGTNNTASGLCSTIPGGFFNTASGDYSFAAGKRARSLHDGSFVWADSQNPLFTTTKENTFLIRAQGGVGINTENPQAGLHVNSNQTDGILAETTAATSGIAVKGLGNSGIGIYGEGGDKGLAGYSSSGTAVYANSDTGFGLKAYNNNSASSTSVAAIYGKSISEDAGQFISTGGVAVRATSNSGDAVRATSDSSDAVRAISTSGIAVSATSTSGIAVSATSDSRIAVSATSNLSNAVHAVTAGGTGVYGKSTGTYRTGIRAGVFGEAAAEDGGRFISSGGYGIYAQGGDWGGYIKGGNGGGLFVHRGSSADAAYFVGNVKIANASNTKVVLQFGEGLDYAEGFHVADKDSAGPGTVLVIDPENPGKLAISSKPYDRKVAGIVAGANGLNSGVRLGCDTFDHDVALAGRVYCNVDATDAAIEPGDLLTTSMTPGYAMKVDDYNRASGATLGKAMERLAKGEKGQILVLVTLQ